MHKPYLIIGAALALILVWKWYQDRAFDQAAAAVGLGNPTVSSITDITDP